MVASRPIAARTIATFTRSYPSFQSTSSAASRPAFFQHSFHPTLTASLTAESLASSQRKWNVLAVAVLAGFVSAYTLTSADSLKLDAAPSSASGLPPLVADPSKQVVVDSDTGLSFPLYLSTPASLKSTSNQSEQPRFRLVGLGVRTVSFLRVKVYVAALYVDEAKLQSRLSQTSNSDKTLEQNIKEMLDDATTAIIRIVPVRNTDFNHLRDGFIRALQNRLKKAIKHARIPSDSPLEQQFQQAIGQIKESFPRGSVPKGSPLDLIILPTGAGKPARMGLNFEYDGQIFGQVQTGAAPAGVTGDKGVDAGFTVARELVLAYFADQGEISTPFKKSVQEGLFQQLPLSA